MKITKARSVTLAGVDSGNRSLYSSVFCVFKGGDLIALFESGTSPKNLQNNTCTGDWGYYPPNFIRFGNTIENRSINRISTIE